VNTKNEKDTVKRRKRRYLLAFIAAVGVAAIVTPLVLVRTGKKSDNKGNNKETDQIVLSNNQYENALNFLSKSHIVQHEKVIEVVRVLENSITSLRNGTITSHEFVNRLSRLITGRNVIDESKIAIGGLTITLIDSESPNFDYQSYDLVTKQTISFPKLKITEGEINRTAEINKSWVITDTSIEQMISKDLESMKINRELNYLEVQDEISKYIAVSEGGTIDFVSFKNFVNSISMTPIFTENKLTEYGKYGSIEKIKFIITDIIKSQLTGDYSFNWRFRRNDISSKNKFTFFNDNSQFLGAAEILSRGIRLSLHSITPSQQALYDSPYYLDLYEPMNRIIEMNKTTSRGIKTTVKSLDSLDWDPIIKMMIKTISSSKLNSSLLEILESNLVNVEVEFEINQDLSPFSEPLGTRRAASSNDYDRIILSKIDLTNQEGNVIKNVIDSKTTNRSLYYKNPETIAENPRATLFVNHRRDLRFPNEIYDSNGIININGVDIKSSDAYFNVQPETGTTQVRGKLWSKASNFSPIPISSEKIDIDKPGKEILDELSKYEVNLKFWYDFNYNSVSDGDRFIQVLGSELNLTNVISATLDKFFTPNQDYRWYKNENGEVIIVLIDNIGKRNVESSTVYLEYNLHTGEFLFEWMLGNPSPLMGINSNISGAYLAFSDFSIKKIRG
jgi:hypothetical protein